MPESQHPHLWIPREHLREEQASSGGGGKPYTRTDYADHGRRLMERTREAKEAIVQKKDISLTDTLIVQVKTAEDVPIREHRLDLQNQGFEVIAYSSRAENAATARIEKTEFEQFSARLHQYTEEATHPGRSTIAVIETIQDVPIEEKLSPELPMDEAVLFECIISLYNVLSGSEKEAILRSMARSLDTRGVTQVRERRYRNGTAVLIATLTPDLVNELGQQYYTVRSIRPNSSAVISRSIPTSPLPNPLEPVRKVARVI
jgi:hypothetical protein